MLHQKPGQAALPYVRGPADSSTPVVPTTEFPRGNWMKLEFILLLGFSWFSCKFSEVYAYPVNYSSRTIIENNGGECLSISSSEISRVAVSTVSGGIPRDEAPKIGHTVPAEGISVTASVEGEIWPLAPVMLKCEGTLGFEHKGRDLT